MNAAASPESNPVEAQAEAILPGGVEALREKSGWLMALGAVLMVLGVLALGASVLVTEVWAVLLAVFLLVGGVMQVVQAAQSRGWRGMLWHLLAGVLYVVAGVILLGQPLLGAVWLTLLLAAFFLVDGVFKVVMALQLTDHPGWAWLLVDGVILAALGILLWAQWPASGMFAIGLFIGIQMIFTGAGFLALAIAARAR
jgi:uncharacterized membrane protein HdeD (DUF308 family)